MGWVMMDEHRKEWDKPFKNPDSLTRVVKVRVLRRFHVPGQVAEPGTIVSVDWCTARDMVFLKKAEWLNEEDSRLQP
jgi:hypothetical protein